MLKMHIDSTSGVLLKCSEIQEGKRETLKVTYHRKDYDKYF